MHADQFRRLVWVTAVGTRRTQEVDTALLRVLAERNAPELYELLDDPRLTLAVEDAEATLRSLKVGRCARQCCSRGFVMDGSEP